MPLADLLLPPGETLPPRAVISDAWAAGFQAGVLAVLDSRIDKGRKGNPAVDADLLRAMAARLVDMPTKTACRIMRDTLEGQGLPAPSFETLRNYARAEKMAQG
jgi:hypothetical protein